MVLNTYLYLTTVQRQCLAQTCSARPDLYSKFRLSSAADVVSNMNALEPGDKALTLAVLASATANPCPGAANFPQDVPGGSQSGDG